MLDAIKGQGLSDQVIDCTPLSTSFNYWASITKIHSKRYGRQLLFHTVFPEDEDVRILGDIYRKKPPIVRRRQQEHNTYLEGTSVFSKYQNPILQFLVICFKTLEVSIYLPQN